MNGPGRSPASGAEMTSGHRLQFQCRALAIELSACLLALMVVSNPTAVRAEVRVQGDAAALRVDASKSHVAEVLSALGPALHVRVKTPIALDKAINGTYVGSLQQVLSRVLDGYNYVIKRRDAAIEVVVIGTRGNRAMAVQAPTPAPARSLAAEWRTSTAPGPQKPVNSPAKP